jgi:sensor domain CHASE-containing protein
MTEQSNGSLSPRTLWLLIAIAVASLVGVFASMATSLAIRDLQASQHQAIDQLKALQEAVSSDRADMKRLSDEVAALNAASAHQQIIPPPSTPAPVPTGQKRGTR